MSNTHNSKGPACPSHGSATTATDKEHEAHSSAINTTVLAAQHKGRPLAIGYITAGFPVKENFAQTVESLATLFDIIEIGVPFSDPVADGPVAERLGLNAVKEGINLDFIFSSLAELPRQVTSRLVLVGYYNNFLQYGLSQLASQCAQLSITGIMIYDLPMGEDETLRTACPQLQRIPLLAHATPLERMQAYAQSSFPYAYIAPAIGATGAEQAIQACMNTCEKAQKVFSAPVGIRYDAHAQGMPKDSLPLSLYESSLLEHLEAGKTPVSFQLIA